MLRPVSDMAADARTGLAGEVAKVAKCREDCDKLTGAVFYKTRKHKNIFHVMRDEITELKADEVLHEK